MEKKDLYFFCKNSTIKVSVPATCYVRTSVVEPVSPKFESLFDAEEWIANCKDSNKAIYYMLHATSYKF